MPIGRRYPGADAPKCAWILPLTGRMAASEPDQFRELGPVRVAGILAFCQWGFHAFFFIGTPEATVMVESPR